MGKGRFAFIMLGLPACAVAQPTASSLADLSLEELANLQITSVSRRAERLADAPASIYVITAADIRRSGATSLPEALRLAPTLHVARIDASQYAISARGFNNSIGNDPEYTALAGPMGALMANDSAAVNILQRLLGLS